MSACTVSVTIPEWLWGRLATVADHKHITVADVIADSLLVAVQREGLRAPTNGERLVSEVLEARASGWRAPVRRRRTKVELAGVAGVNERKDTE